jgi:molybdenum cofactor cytidylyltransferase
MKVAGVVLAAGASTRMGENKALLRAGVTLGGCDPILAVVAEPLEEIKEGCRLEGVRLVVNPDPSSGQISSLRCAIRELDATVSGVVVLLVDQGAIKADTVSQVRKSLASSPVAVARHAGRPGHPTGFSRRAFGDLESEAADGGAREVVQAREQAGQVKWVDVDDPGVVRNINTKERYLAFLAEI